MLVALLLVPFPVEVPLLVLLLDGAELVLEVGLLEVALLESVELLELVEGLLTLALVSAVVTAAEPRPESVEHDTIRVGIAAQIAAESDEDRRNFDMDDSPRRSRVEPGARVPRALNDDEVSAHALRRAAIFRLES